MRFVIDDQPAPDAKIPSAVRRLIELLDSLPDGHLLTATNLASRARVGTTWIHRWCTHPALAGYRTPRLSRFANRVLWGNSATISAYLAEHGQE